MINEEIKEKFLKIKENLETLAITSDIKFKRKLASNSETPINILEILANFNDLQLLSHIIRHPNLNESIILKILNAEEYSEEILEKIKEYKNKFQNVDNKFLIMNENLNNLDFLNLKINLARNINTPKKILNIFLQDKNEKIRESLALNQNLDFEIYNVLKKDKDHFVRINLARNIKTPIKILDYLAHDYIDEIKLEVSKNISCSDETFEFLSKSNNKIKIELILNPSVSIILKDKLSEIEEMKKIYISLPSSPKKLLKELENSKDEEIKKNLAKHPKITNYLIEKFKLDNSEKVKQNLASNEYIEVEILEFLFHKRTSDLVKIGLAGNKKTPIKILEELSFSQNEKILISLSKNQSITEDIFKKLWNRKKLREFLIENKKLPENYLLKILKDEDIKYLLSNGSKTQLNILKEISKDKNYIYDKNIINNKNVNYDILKKYLNYNDIKYDIELAKNKIMKEEDLIILYEKTKTSKYKLDEEYDLSKIINKINNENQNFEEIKELIKYNSNTIILNEAYKSIKNINIENLKQNFEMEEKEKFYLINKKIKMLEFLSLYKYILPKILEDLDCTYEIHENEVYKFINIKTNELKHDYTEEDFENIKIIIDNPKTHLKILMNLSRASKQVKQYLLLKKDLPISVLESIMEDHNMKLDIAKNSKTPTDLLIKLVNYHDIDVLKALAENPNSDIKILNILSSNKKLIKILIKNKNISIELLENLKNENLTIEEQAYIEISLYNMYKKYIM